MTSVHAIVISLVGRDIPQQKAVCRITPLSCQFCQCTGIETGFLWDAADIGYFANWLLFWLERRGMCVCISVLGRPCSSLLHSFIHCPITQPTNRFVPQFIGSQHHTTSELIPFRICVAASTNAYNAVAALNPYLSAAFPVLEYYQF